MRHMKRTAYLCLALLLLTACKHVQPPTVPDPLDRKEISSLTSRLETIGGLSAEVENNLTETPPNVPKAKEINDQVQQVAAKPSPAVIAAVKNDDTRLALVNQQLEQERSLNASKTEQLADLQKQVAEQQAKLNKLKQLESPFYAIKYGVTTLLKRFAWTLAGIGVVYALLRIFAASNPVVGAIFTVVERLVAYLISGISALFPKAVTYGSRLFQRKDATLNVLVDVIETMQPDDTIAELKQKLAKQMDGPHKEEVAEVQKSLGW